MNITVKIPPKIKQDKTKISVAVGESMVNLACSADGDRPINVKWSKASFFYDLCNGFSSKFFQAWVEYWWNYLILYATEIETDAEKKIQSKKKYPQFLPNFMKLGENKQLMNWWNCLNFSLIGENCGFLFWHQSLNCPQK